jgi:hypothetical protein
MLLGNKLEFATKIIIIFQHSALQEDAGAMHLVGRIPACPHRWLNDPAQWPRGIANFT